MSENRQVSNVYLSKDGYNIWANYYNQSKALLDTFEKGHFMGNLGDLRGKKVLDLGAGTGRITEQVLMNGAEVYCVDISEEMLKILKRDFPEAKIFLADAENLPFEDGFFDIVVAGFLIVHLKNLKKSFSEVYRVLKNDGEFLLSNINQRKAPKLKIDNKKEIVIKSFYHRPQDVISSLEGELFSIKSEYFVEEKGFWVNQIIKAIK